MLLYIGGETSGESRFSNLETGSKFALKQSLVVFYLVLR